MLEDLGSVAAWASFLEVFLGYSNDKVGGIADSALNLRENDLQELVRNGYARIYGTKVVTPEGKRSRTYVEALKIIETNAKAAKRGGWTPADPKNGG